MQIAIGMVCIIILVIILQKIELSRFRITVYEPEGASQNASITMMVIADLHGYCYGKQNERLLRAISTAKPDVILIPGDLIVTKRLATYETAYQFLEKLSTIAPVYFSHGNHEQRTFYSDVSCADAYRTLEQKIENLGIHILTNASETVMLKGRSFEIYGVDIPLSCYKKGKRVPLPDDFLENTLGKNIKKIITENSKTKDSVQGNLQTLEDQECDETILLLAHNPAYGRQYAAWGADITISGHTHGGLVRIPGIGSVFSPQFEWFPQFDGGMYDVDGKKLVVSKGLGTHTFHIRIFDRAECVLLKLPAES